MLDKAEYSAFQSTLNSPIVSYRKIALNMLNARPQVRKIANTTPYFPSFMDGKERFPDLDFRNSGRKITLTKEDRRCFV